MLAIILYTLLFGVVMEFEINVILQSNIGGMFGVFLLYTFIGVVTYYTFPYLIRIFGSKQKGFWLSLTIHALFCLFIIEWGFMNNTPWSVPLWLAPIAQLGVFAWWACISAMPYVLTQPAGSSSKRSILFIYGIYALISLPLSIIFGIGPVIFLQPPVYLSFFYFYRKFAQKLNPINPAFN